ncbi:MAG: phospholipid carrier-dependent glycosyltransferase [Candidatus Omnitrophica bacterium]|nr:phospholipid carrier-dependent glycosyltransferase [Candidatus Omnitrophota bacterium]
MESIKVKKIAVLSLFLFIITGIFMRFHHITQNQFFYYDEGMWLNSGRAFVALLQGNPPQGLMPMMKALSISLAISLSSAKSLWLFISNLRGFFIHDGGLYFTRVVSAIFGSLTLGVMYLFSRRYFASRWIALFATALLAVYPSHVYYSRLALQESLSTFCFFLGMYFYVFSKGIRGKTFLSAFLFACVFLSNYRMIIIPVIVGFCELFLSFSEQRKFDVRKYIWNAVTFFAIIFLLGSLYKGANIYITFAWMFHQADSAKGHFEWLNFLSYPYYLFVLESWLFGLLFFWNIYFIIKKEWGKLFPFALSVFMMILFSFPQEKGVRYLCVAMPFMVMAVSVLISEIYKQKNARYQWFLILAAGIMLIVHLGKSRDIIQFQSNYESSTFDILQKNPTAKIFSTQNMVQGLFMPNPKNVLELPRNFQMFLRYYQQGFRYLVIDPQAYVSFTQDGYRFSPPLAGYLSFIVKNLPPYKTYPHFNKAMLERFVLEHNESLSRSIQFLKLNNNGELGALRVYDLDVCIPIMARFAQIKEQKSGAQ